MTVMGWADDILLLTHKLKYELLIDICILIPFNKKGKTEYSLVYSRLEILQSLLDDW